MSDFFQTEGIILKTQPVLEQDKRLELLTMDRGRIGVFARGARRPRSKFIGSTEPFVYGSFSIREGGSAYQLAEVEADEYFEELKKDLEAVYAGMELCEIAMSLSRENADNAELLKLLFVSLRALERKRLSHKLIHAVFVLRALTAEGHGVSVPAPPEGSLGPALAHIGSSSLKALFAFSASPQLEEELYSLGEYNLKLLLGYTLKGRSVVEQLLTPKAP